jgi:hypothetical protein
LKMSTQDSYKNNVCLGAKWPYKAPKKCIR